MCVKNTQISARSHAALRITRGLTVGLMSAGVLTLSGLGACIANPTPHPEKPLVNDGSAGIGADYTASGGGTSAVAKSVDDMANQRTDSASAAQTPGAGADSDGFSAGEAADPSAPAEPADSVTGNALRRADDGSFWGDKTSGDSDDGDDDADGDDVPSARPSTDDLDRVV